MHSRYTLQLLYCLLHMMAWIRSQPVANDTEVISIFRGLSPPQEEKRESSEKVYTEGGSVSTSVDTIAEENSAKSKSTLQQLEIPLPASEATSKIKARKEVIFPNKVVARKGAPFPSSVSPAPVYEIPEVKVTTSYNVTSAKTDVSEVSSTVSSVPSTNTSLSFSPFTAQTTSSSNASLPTKATTPQPIPHKPKVTLVPSDSDAFLKSLKNDRNVVGPVVALVLVPLIVLLALFIYKRVQDSRGAHYTQMGFLVDEMYND